MATSRVKTRESKTGELIAYSETAIRNNASAVEYCRTSMAALSGSTAGKNIDSTFRLGKAFNLKLSFRCFRCSRADRHNRIPVLRAGRSRAVVHAAAQIRLQLAEVFHHPEKSPDQRIPRRTLHVRTVLDISLRYGSCVLECYAEGIYL